MHLLCRSSGRELLGIPAGKPGAQLHLSGYLLSGGADKEPMLDDFDGINHLRMLMPCLTRINETAQAPRGSGMLTKLSGDAGDSF